MQCPLVPDVVMCPGKFGMSIKHSGAECVLPYKKNVSPYWMERVYVSRYKLQQVSNPWLSSSQPSDFFSGLYKSAPAFVCLSLAA